MSNTVAKTTAPRHWRAAFGWELAALSIALCAAVPLIVVALYLFVDGGPAWDHLRATVLSQYAFNTALLMVCVGTLSTLIGVSCAWCVAVADFPGRRFFNWLLVLPLAAPAYVVAYMYTDLLSFTGPIQSGIRDFTGWQGGTYWFPEIRSLGGAAVMLSLVLYPYVYLLARAAFVSQGATQFDAARSLGASPRRAFFKIALPAARPAIAGGIALVLMETLADYGVVDYFAVPTLSTGIFRTWFAMGEKTAALKLAAVMLAFVALLVAMEQASRPKDITHGGRTSRARQRLRLTGPMAAAATTLCAVPVILGFIVPVTVLLFMTLDGGDQLLGRGFLLFAGNTLMVACTAALIVAALALGLSYAQRISGSPISRWSIRMSTLGYALPGTLLAVGLLGPITGIDQILTRWARDLFGWDGGLVLTGTIALLVYACVVRFLTVGFNSISGGLNNISPSMDQAARSLGASPSGVLARIHFPLLRPSILAAVLLVFVDVVRELPATLILRPFNFETLATRVYRLASDERLAEASTAALTIVIVGLIPVILLTRLQKDPASAPAGSV